MGSVTCDGVRFSVYVNDHEPRHVHGLLGCTRVIVDLLPSGDVDLAKRKNVIRPRGAKKSDVRKILSSAAEHFDELIQLWEQIHGEA
jgi:hypothetical protein